MSNATRRIVTTRMTLDLSIPDIQRDVTVTQGDTNRRFEITLVDSGHPYVLNANDKWSVILTGVKPSGATLNNVCDVASGKILYDFASGDQITTEAGAFSVQFNIYDELGEVIATPKIWVTVTPNANRNPVIEDQYTAVSDWIATLNQYEKSEGTREANENTRQANEAERKTAEAERKTAEAERKAAEEQRKLNEAARATLQQQVDNLLNTPAGSTTADLALYDLKLGADGVIYETPGIAVRTQLGRLQGKVPEIDKRLANVESLLDPQLFVEDNTVSAVKDVPENAAPYAKLLEIGGMTYKEGEVLRTDPVTEVELLGGNLFDPAQLLNAPGWTEILGVYSGPLDMLHFTFDGGIGFNLPAFEPNTQYSISVWGYTTDPYYSTPLICVLYEDNSESQLEIDAYNMTHYTLTTDVGKSVKRIYAFFEGELTETLYLKDIQVKKGIDTTYTPYRRHTIPIPAEVQELDGYGWGVNANYYNYIDWEKKQFVKQVHKVVLDGSSNWSTGLRDGGRWFKTKAPVPTVSPLIGLDNKGYTWKAFYSGVKIIAITGANLEEITIYPNSKTDDAKHSTVDDWINQLATWASEGIPLTIFYPISPVVTDISDLLPADNYIGVEGGGTVTMVNEYGYDVPSKVRYQLKRS